MNWFWIIYFLTVGFFLTVAIEGLLDLYSKEATKDILNDPVAIIFLIPIINTILLIDLLRRVYRSKQN